MSDQQIALRVVGRFQRQASAIVPPNREVRVLESAYFADGNGNISLSIIEEASLPDRPGDDTYYNYYMHHIVSHFSTSSEGRFQLGNANMVEWLKDALGRTLPRVQKNQSSWSEDFIGKAKIDCIDGVKVEPGRNQTYAEDSG